MDRNRSRKPRSCRVESLEARQVMSADPLVDLLAGAVNHPGGLDLPALAQPATLDAPPIVLPAELDPPPLPGLAIAAADPGGAALPSQAALAQQSLASAHLLTGLDQVRANYGFDGGGQTVAVIDTGVAWDHFALGGGFGSGYRVVGGWDFAENDANPYDDGPAGFHGTHVSGVIGADGGASSGVAPGVDLVALRVFSDTGAGYTNWVESALQWVHENRNAFENPITAVNLSLGNSWNADTVPNWAALEDEFAQLEADGIFIAVAAGNDFTSYNAPGLSYPAVSPYVVPVMSVDDSGALSYFSQRHTRALAAPGRFISSTAPDYAGDSNGVVDDYKTASGTNMAAPYVAGASVLVREAMEFVGTTGVTQDMIYDHLMATADTLFDSATQQSYKRLNLARAIDALMPADDYGSSVATAYNLGTLGGSLQSQSHLAMDGLIGKLDDADYFTFTAAETGRVTFNATGGTHDFAASWAGFGATGWTSVNAGAGCAMTVVAGQTYTVALSSSGGLGYYGLDVEFENAVNFIDWGAVGVQQTKANLTINGEQWYRITASRNGYLTVDAVAGGQNISLDLYNASMKLVRQGGATDRADVLTTAGTQYYVRVTGTASGVALRLTNAVAISGDTVHVVGTEGNDAIAFSTGTGGFYHGLSVNGLVFAFDTSVYKNLAVSGAGGTDSFVLHGTAQKETVLLGVNSISLTGPGYVLVGSSFENIVVVGMGGDDAAYMYGSAGADTYRTYGDRVVMSGAGYNNRAEGFANTYGFANSLIDVAYMYGSAGADTYRTYADRVIMSGPGYANRAYSFVATHGFADSTSDTALMYDSAGSDFYRAYSDRAIMSGTLYNNRATGFARVTGYASTGYDQAYLHDSAGNDLGTVRSWGGAIDHASGGHIEARGFDLMLLYGLEGGTNTLDLEAVDYVFAQIGLWG
ncbi:Subtilisin NAT precursor [Pirellulimonas nuda]|uniref:Subtilisin NAT n=1 Tax=Pirellulimonas nuda TaxID=2528009 RepID=A0A518DD48_9BACT|nr:S8 family serine peptidase [Pirellulimonas nuda]QDU89407.1 Subtilisin NAT precursor [Pirellulimonas nuda]